MFLTSSQTRPVSLGSRLKRLRLAAAHEGHTLRTFASRAVFSPTYTPPEKMISIFFAPAGANSARLFRQSAGCAAEAAAHPCFFCFLNRKERMNHAGNGIPICGRAGDGASRAPVAAGRQPRLVLQISHGMTEHSGRYDTLAAALAEHGIACAAFDLRGHGRNPGSRTCADMGPDGWE